MYLDHVDEIMLTMEEVSENIEFTTHAAIIFGDFDDVHINSTLRNDYSPPMVPCLKGRTLLNILLFIYIDISQSEK